MEQRGLQTGCPLMHGHNSALMSFKVILCCCETGILMDNERDVPIHLYQSWSRHLLTDQDGLYELYRAQSHPLFFVSCHTSVFTHWVLMQSNTRAVVNSQTLCCLTSLSYPCVGAGTEPRLLRNITRHTRKHTMRLFFYATYRSSVQSRAFCSHPWHMVCYCLAGRTDRQQCRACNSHTQHATANATKARAEH